MAHRTLTALQLGMTLDGMATGPAPKPEAKVVKAVFGKPATPEPLARPSGSPPIDREELARIQGEIVTDLDARRLGKTPVEPVEESARERFRRALDIERQLAAGDGVTRDQERWLSAYQTTPEYQAERLLWDDFGDAIFG